MPWFLSRKPRQPRFLGTAYKLRLLSLHQIAEIMIDQAHLRQAKVELKVGPIAANLGYLSPEDAEKVETHRKWFIEHNEKLDDPVREPRSARRRLSPRVRTLLAYIASVLTLGALVVVWVRGSFTDVVNWAGIAGILWVIVPQLLTGPRLTVSGWLRWLSGPLALCISVLLVREAGAALPWWWKMGLLGLPLLVFFESLASFWRHFQLKTSELRSCLLRCMAKNFRDNYLAVRDGTKQSAVAVSDLLSWTAHIVYLNPWNRLLRYFVPDSFAHPGVTSLWLFRPTESGATIIFTATALKVVGPEAVRDVLTRFQASYHPRIDPAQLEKEQETLTKGGLDPEEAFLTEKVIRLRKAEFVSLPGLVYIKAHGYDGNDILSFWGFEETHYREILEAEAGTNRVVQRGARLRAFAAYPIYLGGPQRGQPPVGVLVAFSSTRNGFTIRDRNALVSSARLLGVLLDQQHVAAVTTVSSTEVKPATAAPN